MPKVPYTNVYDLDYYSGAQMFLYVGDVWIDEITSLQYQVHQSKTPIYGYASQLWDDAAAGPVMVQGNFSINYKEQGYLWAVLNRYFGRNTGGQSTKLLRDKKDRPIIGSNGTRVDRRTIEQVAQGQATTGEKYQFYQALSGFSSFDVSSPKDKVFEDIVEVFEDQIWNTTVKNDNLNSQIRRTDDNQFDNFDMYVVFGNYANPKANHTVQKIIDVRLTTQGKMIQINGQPIQEEYSFIARTVA